MIPYWILDNLSAYAYYAVLISGNVIILCEALYRFSRSIVELKKHPYHYAAKNRFWTILRYAFHLKSIPILILVAQAFMSCLYLIIHSENMAEFFQDICIQFGKIGPFYLFFKYTSCEYSYLHLADSIRDKTGIDYAQGMVSNYFHGYLNLVLPDRGDDLKNIKERMSDYEDRHKVDIPVKRLFILIPDSLYFKPKIESEYLQMAATLETFVKIRAGVSRTFDTAVYKIKKINSYVCLEAATPLLSYADAINHSNGTDEMKIMKREIVIKFCKTLKEFLNESESTRHLCEIVYYPTQDINGHPTDVGKVITEKILQMQALGTAAF